MVSNPTHKVVITIISHKDDPDVNMKVEWDPLMGDDEISEQGYVPAAYKLAENIVFACEDMANTAQLLELEEGDMDAERTIN